MAFNFPLNPAENTIYLGPNNCTYTYVSGRWVGNFALDGAGGGGGGGEGLPVGFVGYYAANSVPSGFLKCNGAAISRTTYAALFTLLGSVYGNGDGSTTFNLPDLRGEFIRGLDDGRGVDSGRAVGTAQSDELKSHVHTAAWQTFAGANAGYPGFDGQGDALAAGPTGAVGGTETRPRNVAMVACIKY